MRYSAVAPAALIVFLVVPPGCARSRTFTIYSKPADAKLVINGVERGPGPITQQFNFGGSSSAARVTAVREGYHSKTQRLTANTPRDTVVIELQPIGPRVEFSIQPAAMVRVNGVLVQNTPVNRAEITLDPATPDKVYTVTAEQTGYAREVRTITSKDPQGYYRIVLRPVARQNGATAQANRTAQTQPSSAPVRQPPPVAVAPTQPARMHRDIIIRTQPPVPNAEIFIAGEKWGDREVRLLDHEFKRDRAGKPVPQPISATAPGFEGGGLTMRWEDNKPVYVIPLGRRRKEVRITTDPPGATVAINGKTLRKDRDGVSSDTVYFPPEDPPQRPATLAASVTPANPSAGFEPAQLEIGWDEGKRDYAVKLEPSRYVKVPMLQAVPTWEARGGWRASANRVETLAARDASEGGGRPMPQSLTDLPPGTMLDSVIASPDGALLLYTELIAASGKPMRAQMRLLNSDGTPGASLPSDGRHFDAMPSFTPDGSEIVFTSDRSGQGLDVWSMKVAPGGAVKQLARGGEKAALWPMIDASPRPRLFYEEFLRNAARPTDPRAEVHMVELEADPPTNRALSPGTRPRASPRADAVVFTRPDPVTGKRDLYLISDKDGALVGATPINLTKSPDVDDCDPAFSRTGGKIAYASDRGSDEANRRNFDLYVLTISDPSHPVRLTYNGSLDDSPAWDPTGKSVYFRSNRGGKWGVWKAAVP